MADYQAINAMYEYCKDILGEDVTFEKVQNELFLIEIGGGCSDNTLNEVIRKAIKESR